MRERLRELMAGVFDIPVEDVTPEATMNNLEGWDSLGHLRLIAALEQQLGVRLTQDDIVRMTSFAEIEAVLKAKG